MAQTADAVNELEQAIRGIDHPAVAAVAKWDVRLDEDWSGDPAVYITVTFKDSEIRRIWPTRNELRASIEAAATRLLPGRLVYVRLTAQSIAIDPDPPSPKRRSAARHA